MTGAQALEGIRRVRSLFTDIRSGRVRPCVEVQTHDAGTRISVKHTLVRCTPEDD